MTKKTKKEASGAAAVTLKLERFKEFFEQSKVELKKVTWPNRKETMTTGAAVLVLVVVMSVFLGLVDMALAKIIEAILS